jgi:hypothetical protein
MWSANVSGSRISSSAEVDPSIKARPRHYCRRYAASIYFHSQVNKLPQIGVDEITRVLYRSEISVHDNRCAYAEQSRNIGPE